MTLSHQRPPTSGLEPKELLIYVGVKSLSAYDLFHKLIYPNTIRHIIIIDSYYIMIPPIAKFVITFNSFLSAIVWVDLCRELNLIKTRKHIK